MGGMGGTVSLLGNSIPDFYSLTCCSRDLTSRLILTGPLG